MISPDTIAAITIGLSWLIRELKPIWSKWKKARIAQKKLNDQQWAAINQMLANSQHNLGPQENKDDEQH